MILKNEDTIFTFLAANDIDYFVMGSVRFGYDIMHSDIDVCVFIPGEKLHDLLTIINATQESPFNTRGENYSITNTVVYKTNFFAKKVHLLICHNYAQYDRLEKEHEEVETLLKENKILKTYITQLKRTGPDISGSVLYKALVSLILIQFVDKILEKGGEN